MADDPLFWQSLKVTVLYSLGSVPLGLAGGLALALLLKLMAASFVALIPLLVIFFFAQRLFIKGIVFTSIKG